MKLFFWKKNSSLTPEEKKRRKKERLLLILSGALTGLSFPPVPFPFTILILFGLVPYFYVIERREKLSEINSATYLFALIFCLITLYWVGSWQETADPFLMISGVVLVFFNPIFFLIPSTLYYIAQKVFARKYAIFLLPFFWVTYEYLYMITDASFPWLTLGNSLPYFLSFIQIADIIGTLGLSLSVLFINLFLYKSLINYKNSIKRFTIYLSSAIVIAILFLIYGNLKLSNFKLSDEKIDVAIVQPNLNPWEKWSGGNLNDITDIYFNLSRKAINEKTDLLIWPETSLPVYLLSGTHSETLESIYNFVNETKVPLLTGMPDIRYYNKNDKMPDDVKFAEGGGFYYTTYNAIYLFTPGTREIQRYGKMKLVPFGERVPFVDALPFLGDLIKWGVGLSGWNIGKDSILFSFASSDSLVKGDSIKVNGLVCYESIYPSFTANFVNKGADFISVVTNDSWYGNSSGPYQHKEMSVLRAIENRRSVVRSANGGISCIINPLGKTEVETKMFTQTFLSGEIILQKEETFFTQNPLIIPVISSIISLWFFGIFLLKKFKEKFLK